jgi:cobalt-zinc-cadmium efflux system outer membrane protein
MQCNFSFSGVISVILVSTTSIFAQSQEMPDFSEPVSYERALQLAIDRDPILRRFEQDDEAAVGQVEQAALRPNPVVGAEIENLLGTGPFQGVDGFEVTLSVSQLIETAGKRQRRTDLAERERALIPWDREERIADLEATVRERFVEVLLTQRAVSLGEERLQLAEESVTETNRLVDAARSPEVDLTRAQLAVRQEAFSLQQATRALRTAKMRLASIWGTVSVLDFAVVGEIRLEAAPELLELVGRLPQTASVARFEAEERARSAAVELEESRAVPDFEVFGGARYFNENSGEAAFVLGIEMPWPLFDKNQGNIRSARARLRAVGYEREAVRRQMLQELADSHRGLVSAYEEIRALENELRPAATKTLEDTQSGYERGQFTLLSVLESRRALFEVQEAHLDALNRYAAAWARIEALTRKANIQ